MSQNCDFFSKLAAFLGQDGSNYNNVSTPLSGFMGRTTKGIEGSRN